MIIYCNCKRVVNQQTKKQKSKSKNRCRNIRNEKFDSIKNIIMILINRSQDDSVCLF